MLVEGYQHAVATAERGAPVRPPPLPSIRKANSLFSKSSERWQQCRRSSEILTKKGYTKEQNTERGEKKKQNAK
ncbi:hypothetical protein TNCV_1340521 [Trichonephila clavipes]|nr:hypothetical protein TNCV_1340521 [Trichonephila clavipes]